jgi:hypothetical protein
LLAQEITWLRTILNRQPAPDSEIKLCLSSIKNEWKVLIFVVDESDDNLRVNLVFSKSLKNMMLIFLE